MTRAALCDASPSLALLKYWGKSNSARNIPATTSLAVSLAGLKSTTRVHLLAPHEGADRVLIDGALQPPDRFERFFDGLRRALRSPYHFEAESTNNFPTSAGLASSSSGFAALTLACCKATGVTVTSQQASALARLGSVSAARAVFGGFTLLEAGATAAKQLYDESHWPELRITVCIVEKGTKPISSRNAMEASRLTSPYFRRWVRASARAVPQALKALATRDIEQLGDVARLSYLRMFATIISTKPPIQYWLPATVSILDECEAMRNDGIGVWETMDAGPQVKLLCLADEVEAVQERILDLDGVARTIVCTVGGAPAARLEGE